MNSFILVNLSSYSYHNSFNMLQYALRKRVKNCYGSSKTQILPKYHIHILISMSTCCKNSFFQLQCNEIQ